MNLIKKKASRQPVPCVCLVGEQHKKLRELEVVRRAKANNTFFRFFSARFKAEVVIK